MNAAEQRIKRDLAHVMKRDVGDGTAVDLVLVTAACRRAALPPMSSSVATCCGLWPRHPPRGVCTCHVSHTHTKWQSRVKHALLPPPLQLLLLMLLMLMRVLIV